LATCALFLSAAANTLSASDGFEESFQPLVEKYCYRCHGGERTRGGVDLTTYETSDSVFEDRELWLEALWLIENEEMPSKGELPSLSERKEMIDWLESRLNEVDWSQIREAGHVSLPRLTKNEYNNTIRDLLGLDIQSGNILLEEGEGDSGFTTDRDNLFITPATMEKYFTAADVALEAVIALQKPTISIHLESEEMFMTESDQPEEYPDEFFGYNLNRGQMTLYDSIEFPADGYYTLRMRVLPTVTSESALRVRLNNDVVGDLSIDSTEPTFVSLTFLAPKGYQQLALNYERSLLPHAIAKQYSRQNKTGSIAVDWLDIQGPLNPAGVSEHNIDFFPDVKSKRGTRKAAARTLRRFARRAFRRPIENSEVNRYLAIYKSARSNGETYASSLKLALTGVMVSPHFLFRHEFGPDNTLAADFALNDFQIASRLSYFLWMSMPDEELFSLAKKGKLSHPDVLRAQVQRMVKDPKATSFTNAFLSQWLDYDAIGVSVIPDKKVFPEFTPALAIAMKDETRLSFDHIIRHNQSLLSLIDTDTTYLNEQLATHYGIDGVEGTEMRAVSLTDKQRGGLIGMGSVLTATSTSTRTNPVVRGIWVLEKILGDHIGDPPDDAGQLDENAGTKEGLTLREELESHRTNPECGICHDKIDPIGFGLENFDGIGRFRTTDNGLPIDNRGEVDGFTFSGAIPLKGWLLSERRDAFIENVNKQMLSFALGRKLETFDQGPLLDIKAKLENNEYKVLTLLEEVVLSYPFLHQGNTNNVQASL